MNDDAASSRTDRIRELNDEFRRTFLGGRVMLSSGITDLPDTTRAAALHRIAAFKGFNEDTDPHHEHDFVAIDINGSKIFGKIDYYAPNLKHGSDDPADLAKTTRGHDWSDAGGAPCSLNSSTA